MYVQQRMRVMEIKVIVRDSVGKQNWKHLSLGQLGKTFEWLGRLEV